MKVFNTYLLLILAIIVQSCGQKNNVADTHSIEKGIVDVVITHSAGDRWSDSDSFLPLPMNVGKVNEKEVLILTDRLETNTHVLVKPLGAINIIEHDSLKTYVLSIPHKQEGKAMKADGFDEFSTVHSSAKWIVEQYILNRKDGHSTRLKSWDNEKSAMKSVIS